jgi:hypothetical protein
MLCVLRPPHNYHMGEGAFLVLIKGTVIRDLLHSTKIIPKVDLQGFKKSYK